MRADCGLQIFSKLLPGGRNKLIRRQIHKLFPRSEKLPGTSGKGHQIWTCRQYKIDFRATGGTFGEMA
jgi:hypothetical protein